MEILLTKLPNGTLAPADEGQTEKLSRLKVGGMVRADIKQVRNYKFLQKMHCLYKLAFDHFTELCEPMLYKGADVTPSYDRFRADLTILAGHFTPVYAINGEVRLEAKSIAYANCTEEEAEAIFSDVITAALKFVYKGKMQEAEMRALVDQILSFS